MRMIGMAIAAIAFSIFGQPARAGDTAELNILGFTSDGDIFAFEEFGVQDGSGFPYANRFYVEVATDSFVSGTPIRVRIDDESASLADARAEARERGQAIVAEDELAGNRGQTVGANAITELSADPHRIAVNPRAVVPPIDDALEFRLIENMLPAPERCRDLGDHTGFSLLRLDPTPGGTTVALHQDDSVPASRGCPNGYRIGAVQTFFPADAPPVFAVLIAIRSFGFEGPDHRWMAVAGRL